MQSSKWKQFFQQLSNTKKILLGFCIFAIAVSMGVNAFLLARLLPGQEEEIIEEPAADRLEELQASKDNVLYTDLVPQIADYITDKGYISDTWSFAVIDCETGDMASYNSHPMCSASIIKQYIMGAVYEDYENILEYYSENDIKAYLRGMIVRSDNDCANALIAACGYGDVEKGINNINAFCRKYGYTQTRLDHQFYMEGNPEEDNLTSAVDNATYQYDILKGRFAHSEDMLELLKSSAIRHKIPAGIPDSNVQTANKTGDLDTVENDCAIIWADNGTYILSIMSSGLYNASYTRILLRGVSTITYNYFKELERPSAADVKPDEEAAESDQSAAEDAAGQTEEKKEEVSA